MNEIKQLCARVPVEEGPEQQTALEAIRDVVAGQWEVLANSKLGAVDYRRRRDGLLKQLEEVMTIHGEDVPFAPDLPLPPASSEPGGEEQAAEEQASPGRDGGACVKHVFRFLQNSDGVWTVLQAQEG